MSGSDKAKNKAEELKGKAKEALGDATDNEQWQVEGRKPTRQKATSNRPARSSRTPSGTFSTGDTGTDAAVFESPVSTDAPPNQNRA